MHIIFMFFEFSINTKNLSLQQIPSANVNSLYVRPKPLPFLNILSSFNSAEILLKKKRKVSDNVLYKM